METIGGVVQEGRSVRRRHGVRGGVPTAGGGGGAAQLVPGTRQLRVLLCVPLSGILNVSIPYILHIVNIHINTL